MLNTRRVSKNTKSLTSTKAHHNEESNQDRVYPFPGSQQRHSYNTIDDINDQQLLLRTVATAHGRTARASRVVGVNE